MPKAHRAKQSVCAAATVNLMSGFRSDAEIGQVLKDLRNQADLKQSELAQAAEIEQPILSRIERGERAITAREVLLFSDFLGVDPDRILRKEVATTEILLRAAEEGDEAVRQCVAIFDECIDDYFGLKALLP